MIHAELLYRFGRVGIFGFGGGPSMIPLLKAECVEAGLMSEERFLEALAAGNALPGPIATKMAVAIGWEAAGVSGALVALVGLILPSALLMLAVGALLARHREQKLVAAALAAVKPAVVGMVLYTALELAPTAVKGVGTGLIVVLAFVALAYKVHPGVVIAASIVVGIVAFR